MDNDKAAQVIGTPEGFQFPLPLHDSPVMGMRYEVKSGGTIRSDPQTAHNAVGDTLYEKSLPETCGLCKAEALAKAASDAASAGEA